MSQIRITFEIEKPEGVTENDYVAWINFQLHETNEIDAKNPLAFIEFEPIYVDIREV